MNLTDFYTEAANTAKAVRTEALARAIASSLGEHWPTASDHVRQRLRDTATVTLAAWVQFGGGQ